MDKAKLMPSQFAPCGAPSGFRRPRKLAPSRSPITESTPNVTKPSRSRRGIHWYGGGRTGHHRRSLGGGIGLAATRGRTAVDEGDVFGAERFLHVYVHYLRTEELLGDDGRYERRQNDDGDQLCVLSARNE